MHSSIHRKNDMKFLRIGQVMQLTGLSRMTIYRLELAGEFPKRRRLSKNSVAWLDTDIAQWAESRPISPLRGTAGHDVRLRWHGLRLAHRISCDLARDLCSPHLAGYEQGYAGSRGMRNARTFRGLSRLRRCNPGHRGIQSVWCRTRSCLWRPSAIGLSNCRLKKMRPVHRTRDRRPKPAPLSLKQHWRNGDLGSARSIYR